MGIRTLAGAAALSIGVMATPVAAQTFSGATTLTSPTYNRVLSGVPPTSLSGVGTAVHYQTVGFTVGATGSYVFQMSAIAPVNWDTFLTLYTGSFNPASPLTNAVAANDDNPTIGLSGFTTNLSTGTSYFAVATGFSNTDVGTYSLAITGPGVVTFAGAPAVPEPATWAMLLVGFGAIGGTMRRRAAVRMRVGYA